MLTKHEALAPLRAASMAEPGPYELVLLAQKGNMAALAALYDQHYGLIFRYLRAHLGDRHAVEDLTGDVFQRMLAGLAGYRAQGVPFRAWLFRIAHNLLIDHYRRAGRAVVVEWDDSLPAVDTGADPASRVEQTLAIEKVYRALAGLDAHQREAVTLRFIGELSVRETALALGKSEHAVKALQRRGLAALRLALGDGRE
jgi:RNA polymerase sigma-70 factor, ECF subfamily